MPEETSFKDKSEVKEEQPEVVAAMGVSPKDGFWEVNVMSLFGALKRDGEAKLSDHYVDRDKDKERKLTDEDKNNIKVLVQFEQMKKKHLDSVLFFR